MNEIEAYEKIRIYSYFIYKNGWEDLAQDSYMLYKQYKINLDTKNPKALLYKICLRKRFMDIRSQSKRKDRELEYTRYISDCYEKSRIDIFSLDDEIVNYLIHNTSPIANVYRWVSILKLISEGYNRSEIGYFMNLKEDNISKILSVNMEAIKSFSKRYR